MSLFILPQPKMLLMRLESVGTSFGPDFDPRTLIAWVFSIFRKRQIIEVYFPKTVIHIIVKPFKEIQKLR